MSSQAPVLQQFLHSRRTLPLMMRILGGASLVVILLSVIIYGVTVYYENQVVRLGRETRVIQEENLDLEISLDRLQSYQKVGEASSQISGLQVATDVVDVVEEPHQKAQAMHPPLALPPKELYGY